MTTQPETPHMSDKSDNISDKSLHESDRQALRADITARFENTLRSLDDGKRAAALADLAALDGETM